MRVLNAAFRQPWETFVALIGTHGLAVSLGSAHCTLPRPIGAGFGSIEASLKSELYACGSGVRPVSSRSLAQRLKRRESRSMPPEHRTVYRSDRSLRVLEAEKELTDGAAH